jgi:hypothetical protein
LINFYSQFLGCKAHFDVTSLQTASNWSIENRSFHRA